MPTTIGKDWRCAWSWVAAAMVVHGFATGAAAQPFDKVLIADKLNAYFDDYVNPPGQIMGTMAVSVEGEIIFDYQMGFANEGVKADPNTQYRIGSITKTFTATMILQLVDQGLLTLDDTFLAEFYPELPNADSITIRQMLQHQSGLRSITDVESYADYYMTGQSKEGYLELLQGDDFAPEFPPGYNTRYSNSNYLLLGFIVEDVSGLSYPEYLEQNIVQPVNLTRTATFQPASVEDNIAISFSTPQWTPITDETHPSVPGGAGGLMSTAADLVAFYRALLHTPGTETDTSKDQNNTATYIRGDSLLLSASSLTAMTTFVNDEVGLGLFLFPLTEEWVAWEHSGGIDGFSSLAAYYPQQDVAIAFIVNGIAEEEDTEIERDPLEDVHAILMDAESFQVPELNIEVDGEPEDEDEDDEDTLPVAPGDVADGPATLASGGTVLFRLESVLVHSFLVVLFPLLLYT